MSWSLFADAADECARHGVEVVYLSGFGEPLTDKGLAEKVAYAHSKGLCTSIVTNASLLDERRTKELIKAGLDEVNISIDGFTPEVYTPHRGRRRRLWPPCIYPFTQLSVYWDGTVPVCCLDYEAEGWVGRFGEQSLTQIWQDQAINHYRKRHLAQDGRLPSPCDRCSYFSVWW